MNDLHMNGEYKREPWGYAGMLTRVHRVSVNQSLYALKSARGTIATATEPDPLIRLARSEGWIPQIAGRDGWTTVPRGTEADRGRRPVHRTADTVRKTIPQNGRGGERMTKQEEKAYDERRRDVRALLVFIGLEVQKHGEYARTEGVTRDHIDDLARMRKGLVELLAELGQQDEAFVEERLAELKNQLNT